MSTWHGLHGERPPAAAGAWGLRSPIEAGTDDNLAAGLGHPGADKADLGGRNVAERVRSISVSKYFASVRIVSATSGWAERIERMKTTSLSLFPDRAFGVDLQPGLLAVLIVG